MQSTGARHSMSWGTLPPPESHPHSATRASESPAGVLLLGDRLAGASQLFGEVLQLGEAVLHGHHRRFVIDVHTGFKRKIRDRRRVDVDQTPLWMPGKQMAAAGLAPLPVGLLVRVVLLDLVFALGHLDRVGLPQRECVDRAGGPAPTRLAVAIAGALRSPRDFDRDCTAVALPFEGLFILVHGFSLCSRVSSRRRPCRDHATQGEAEKPSARRRSWSGSPGNVEPRQSPPYAVGGGSPVSRRT